MNLGHYHLREIIYISVQLFKVLYYIIIVQLIKKVCSQFKVSIYFYFYFLS
jgi:hypothetical protein